MSFSIRHHLLAAATAVLATIGAIAATPPAKADTSIFVQGAFGYPPAPRYEPVPPIPYGVVPAYAYWQPGAWVWNGYGYVWQPGRYIQRGAVYASGYWYWDHDGRRMWQPARHGWPYYYRDRDHDDHRGRYYGRDRYDGRDRYGDRDRYDGRDRDDRRDRYDRR